MKEKLLNTVTENELFRFLGVEVAEAEKTRVVLTMPVTSKVHQYIGIMNGGVSLYLCETAASIGAVLNADLTKVTPVGIEINANHVRAASKGLITITATPISPGKTVQVWLIEITNDKGKLVCTSRCSILLKRGPAVMESD